MIRRPLTIASTACLMLLLGTSSAMATTSTGSTGPVSANTACTGDLAATITPTEVVVTGTVNCTADTNLALQTSATGLLSVSAKTLIEAKAGVDVAINATLPAVGCTKAGAVLNDLRTGATVAAAVVAKAS